MTLITKRLTIAIPTFNRPDSLSVAVRSVFAQTGLVQGLVDCLIADNSPDGNARETYLKLKAEAPTTIALRYLHEPRPGVASIRNAILNVVDRPFLAFIDDDMSLAPDWMTRMIDNWMRYQAPVTFSPIETALPDDIKQHRPYFAAFFARESDAPSGLTDEHYGAGGTLMHLPSLPSRRPLFNSDMDQSGGEDDLLFRELALDGNRFGWCAEAIAYEHPLRERLTLTYTLARAFSYGQAPVTLARKEKRYPLMAFWVMVGGAKAVLHSAQYAALRLIKHDRRIYAADKAIQGIGKVGFWIDLNFYGDPEQRGFVARLMRRIEAQAARNRAANEANREAASNDDATPKKAA